MRLAFASLMLVLVCFGNHSYGQDWPQWRGPNRDDISEAKGLLKSWPEDGPKQLWVNKKSGLGYAGFSIVEGKLFTMGLDADETFGLCLDADSGKELWRTTIDGRFKNGWGDGPRSTPTVAGSHVYMLTSKGNLVCLKIEDGAKVWEKSLTSDFGGKVPSWGFSESVLVDGDHVLATPGGKQGTIVCLDRKTGKTIWQSSDVTEPAHYSSIIKIEANNQKQYVQLTPRKLFGVSDKGKLLWSSEWNGRIAVIPTPIFHDSKVYVSSGYEVGSMLVDISGKEAKEVWKNRIMKNHHGGVILLNGHLYGYSDKRGWVCQDFKTGEAVLSDKALRKGAIGYADGHFYCIEERSGKVAMFEATEKAFNKVSEFQLKPLSENRNRRGGIWVHPTIANGKLYLRDQELIHCYDIKAKSAPESK